MRKYNLRLVGTSPERMKATSIITKWGLSSNLSNFIFGSCLFQLYLPPSSLSLSLGPLFLCSSWIHTLQNYPIPQLKANGSSFLNLISSIISLFLWYTSTQNSVPSSLCFSSHSCFLVPQLLSILYSL